MIVNKNYTKSYAVGLVFVMQFLDFGMLIASGILTLYLNFGTLSISHEQETVGLIVVLAWLAIASHHSGLYQSWRGISLWMEIKDVSWALFLVFILEEAVANNIIEITQSTQRTFFWKWLACAMIMLLMYRVTLRYFLRWMRRKGYNRKSIVIAGAGDLGSKVIKELTQNAWIGLDVIACFDDKYKNNYLESVENIPIKGTLDDLHKFVEEYSVEEVWITMPLRAEMRVKMLLEALRHSTLDVKFIPDIFGFSLLNHSFAQISGIPVVNLSLSPMSGINRVIKAFEDRILAMLILLVCFPFMLLIAIAVKVSSPGPIIFRQMRHGCDGKKIEIWKFRSMYMHTELTGQITQAQKNDSRITRVGSFLRRYSLDEFPQFFHVLQGYMSIVGPRPHAVEHNMFYRDEIDLYMKRHIVKPGITGWAQINGLRGETDTIEKMRKRIEYDLYYIENWSLIFDIKIIFLTILKMCSKQEYFVVKKEKDASIKFRRETATNVKNMLIYGAGSAGKRLLTALNDEKDVDVLGFIDDNKDLIKQRINGVPIYSLNMLPSLIRKHQLEAIVIALSSISQSRRAEILRSLEPYHLKILFIPDIKSLAYSYKAINDLRMVKIDDLIDHDPVALDLSLLTINIQNRSILVVGAGGSVGSELCHNLIKFKPHRLVLIDFSENALSTILSKLQNNIENVVELVPIIGSFGNYLNMKTILNKLNIHTVYHAASYIDVPVGSNNIISFVENNVIGTNNLIMAAVESKVKQFVFISSEHASQPENIVSSAKRFSELIVQACAEMNTGAVFSCVRFGQTMSSSLMPFFYEQLKNREPISIINYDTIYYSMTTSEAAQLIIQASFMSNNGDLLSINMGKPNHIIDLKLRMMRLSGLAIQDKKYFSEVEESLDEIRTNISGTVFFSEENSINENNMISRVCEKILPWSKIQEEIQNIVDSIDKFDSSEVVVILKRVTQA